MNNRGRGPNERGCYDFLHDLGFTGEREIECRGSVGAVISSTVSTRETSTQTLDTRLLCGPSFFLFVRKGESECSGFLLRDPQEMVGQCGRSRDATSHSLCDSPESPVRKKVYTLQDSAEQPQRVSQVTHTQCTAQVTVARETRTYGAAFFQLCPPPPRPPSLRALLSV